MIGTSTFLQDANNETTRLKTLKTRGSNSLEFLKRDVENSQASSHHLVIFPLNSVQSSCSHHPSKRHDKHGLLSAEPCSNTPLKAWPVRSCTIRVDTQLELLIQESARMITSPPRVASAEGCAQSIEGLGYTNK
jgi:hypothetical protein